MGRERSTYQLPSDKMRAKTRAAYAVRQISGRQMGYKITLRPTSAFVPMASSPWSNKNQSVPSRQTYPSETSVYLRQRNGRASFNPVNTGSVTSLMGSVGVSYAS